MDLDHVCTLHKRWFRNLRIIAQRPDYVEYHLTSLFYGLKQETGARGGPIDENRYWYEFVAPLARMRVEGLLEGPDGDGSQTETISFSFHGSLAPLFWLLRPLFKMQKQDILRDDSALLERVYELDAKGLEPSVPRVVVYGGDGFFGRLVVEDLLKCSPAEIVAFVGCSVVPGMSSLVNEVLPGGNPFDRANEDFHQPWHAASQGPWFIPVLAFEGGQRIFDPARDR
jgi:hypothetical protein